MRYEKESTQTIKEVSTLRYQVSLVQASSGRYYIVYGSSDDCIVHKSEAVLDYNIASYLFDIKLNDLEMRLQ